MIPTVVIRRMRGHYLLNNGGRNEDNFLFEIETVPRVIEIPLKVWDTYWPFSYGIGDLEL